MKTTVAEQIAARLAACAAATTTGDFSRAADRLAQIGMNTTDKDRIRAVRVAVRRATRSFFERSA